MTDSHLVMVGMDDITADELGVMKQAADLLYKHYPDHAWVTSCTKGVLDVRNLSLSGQMGFRITLPKVYSASDLDKQVMRAGGEILERYRQKRGAFNLDRAMTAPQNSFGNHVPDL